MERLTLFGGLGLASEGLWTEPYGEVKVEGFCAMPMPMRVVFREWRCGGVE